MSRAVLYAKDLRTPTVIVCAVSEFRSPILSRYFTPSQTKISPRYLLARDPEHSLSFLLLPRE